MSWTKSDKKSRENEDSFCKHCQSKDRQDGAICSTVAYAEFYSLAVEIQPTFKRIFSKQYQIPTGLFPTDCKYGWMCSISSTFDLLHINTV